MESSNLARVVAGAVFEDHLDLADNWRIDSHEGLNAGGEAPLREGRDGNGETNRELEVHRDQL
jgi:hypothetical protein